MVSVSEDVQWRHLWGSSWEICRVLPMSVWGRGHLGNSRAAILEIFHCFFAAHDIILSMRWWGLNTGGVVIGFLWIGLTRMRKPSEPLAMRKSKAHWEESPVNSACNAALLGNKSTTSKAGKAWISWILRQLQALCHLYRHSRALALTRFVTWKQKIHLGGNASE